MPGESSPSCLPECSTFLHWVGFKSSLFEVGCMLSDIQAYWSHSNNLRTSIQNVVHFMRLKNHKSLPRSRRVTRDNTLKSNQQPSIIFYYMLHRMLILLLDAAESHSLHSRPAEVGRIKCPAEHSTPETKNWFTYSRGWRIFCFPYAGLTTFGLAKFFLFIA